MTQAPPSAALPPTTVRSTTVLAAPLARPRQAGRWPMGTGIRAWAVAHPVVILVPLVVLAVVVQGVGATRWPAFGDDEGTYVAQAWALRSEGSLSHYTYWYDHPPFGWIQLAAGQWLFSLVLPADPMAAGRLLVVPYAVTSALLTGLLALRLGLTAITAAAATALTTLSPLALFFTRGVYLDVIGLPWLLLAFVLLLSRRGDLALHATAGLAFAGAILSKETFVLALPGLLLALRRGSSPNTRAFSLAAFLSTAGLVVLAYPLLAVLKGELVPGEDRVSLWDAAVFQLVGRTGTGTALDPASPAAGLVRDWLALDPWLLGGGVLLAVPTLASARLRVPAATLLLLVLVGLRPGYLPVPYVVVLLPFAAIVVAGATQLVLETARRTPLTQVVSVLAVAGLVAVAAPGWVGGVRTATTADSTAAHDTAVRTVVDSVPRQDRVLVDNTYYVDLVEAGFEPRYGAVWFYKMDLGAGLDPSVVRRLPDGWRDLDWVLLTPVMRDALEADPDALSEVRLAVANSVPVVTFGTGDDEVELRRVQPSQADQADQVDP